MDDFELWALSWARKPRIPKRSLSSRVWSLHNWKSFCRASRLQFQYFLQMVNKKVRDGWTWLESSLGKSLTMHTHTQQPLWEFYSPSSCQLTLVLERTDNKGLSRTYASTNHEEIPSKPKKPLYKVFLLWPCSQTVFWNGWTQYRPTVCTVV